MLLGVCVCVCDVFVFSVLCERVYVCFLDNDATTTAKLEANRYVPSTLLVFDL